MDIQDKSNSQFSIKDIDLPQLVKILSKHQNTVIKFILIMGTLIWTVALFNDHHNKERDIRIRMSNAQDKVNAIKGREAAIRDLVNFKSSLPKAINIFDFISLISNYAKYYHNNIISYVPDKSKNMGLYDVLTVHYNVMSDNFKDMMLFLRKIEESNYPIRVDSWSGNESEDGKIIFTTEISVVHIHP